MSTRLIEVVPYNPEWPALFEAEAKRTREALGDNCVAIHHIGSTAVPGLSAKPVIDILPVVRELRKVDASKMESLGYESKGEYGIPFRRYFQKGGDQRTHQVHIFEEENPEIDRHLKFRDWMRTHPDDAKAYGDLKLVLVQKFPRDIFKYTCGKGAFIAGIDAKDGYEGWRIVHALTEREWEAVRAMRQTYFFKENPDPYTWTFDHKDHVHFVFYKNTEVIGYAHLQLWPERRAAMRIVVVEESHRTYGHGGQFLALCERWLTDQDFEQLLVQSSPDAHPFYEHNGYVAMPFNDPDGYPSDPQDIEVGKLL